MSMLVLVLVTATAMRLRGLDFGLPALLDPDEPIFVLLGLKLIKEGTLNPGWFGHPGTVTIYAMALVQIAVVLVGKLTGRFPDTAAFTAALYHDPGIVMLPGRVMMLLSGLATIVLAWRLAGRVFDRRVALLAAVLLAINPVHIRYSQIIRTDMQATVFVLLSLLAATSIAERGRTRAYLMAGAWLGVACATKWPSVTAVAGVIGATGWRWREYPMDRRAALRGLVLFGAATVGALVLVSPFLLLDWATLVSNLHGEGRSTHLGATGYDFLGNVWWYLSHPLIAGLGPAGLVLALSGLFYGAWTRPAFGVVVVPTIVAFLVSISAQGLIWERWVVPVLPLLTIAAAYAAVRAADATRAWLPRLAAPAAIALGLLVALPPLRTADAQAAERAIDTRRLATAWALRHIPAGSTVGIEYLAFDVIDAPWRFLYPAGDRGCVDVRANLKGQVTVARVDRWRRARPVVDFGGIDAELAQSCRGDYLILANYDRYLAEADRFPAEIANYRRAMAGGQMVATFVPRPGAVGGPIVRIVQVPGARQPRRP